MGAKKRIKKVPVGEDTKICLDCGYDIPLREYHKDKSKPDGHHGVCKRCMKIRSRANYKKRKRQQSQLRAMKNRKEKLETLPNELTLEEWLETLEWFEYCCAYCGRPIKMYGDKSNKESKDNKDNKDSKRLEVSKEHVVPVDDGGPTIKWNIVPACTRCNTSKGNRRMIEWYIDRPYFSMTRLERIVSFMRKYRVGVEEGGSEVIQVGSDRDKSGNRDRDRDRE